MPSRSITVVPVANLINEIIETNETNNMACQSCAAKQQSVAGRFAKSVTVTTFEIPEECVYTKEQLQEHLLLLEANKGEIEKKQLTALSVKIFKLKRALKEYDTNCNKYLKDLDGLLKK